MNKQESEFPKAKLSYSELEEKIHELRMTLLWISLSKPLTETHLEVLLAGEEHRIEQLHSLILKKIDRLAEHLTAKESSPPDFPNSQESFYSDLLGNFSSAEGLTQDHIAEYIDALEQVFQKFPLQRTIFAREARMSIRFDKGVSKWFFSHSWSPENYEAFFDVLELPLDERKFKNWGQIEPVPILGITTVAREVDAQVNKSRQRLRLWLESMSHNSQNGYVAVEVVVPNLKTFEKNGKLPQESVGPFESTIIEALNSIIKSLKRDLNRANMAETIELLEEIYEFLEKNNFSLNFTEPPLELEQQSLLLTDYFESFMEVNHLSSENPGRTLVWEKELGELTEEGRIIDCLVAGRIRLNCPDNFIFGLSEITKYVGSLDVELVTQLSQKAIPLLYELPDTYYVYGSFKKAVYRSEVLTTQEMYQKIAEGLEEAAEEYLDMSLELQIP